MQIIRGRAPGKPSQRRSTTFTGTVWVDPVAQTDGIVINQVFFEPGARTYWHRHEIAQILFISHGCGIVANEAGEVHSVRAGDVVYIPIGEKHWHGADANTYMLHLAISLGKTEWLEEVPPEAYESAVGGVSRD
ncbi:MAG: cupin domain-containing protein [Alicyclobacillus sp.]|nr:cupin domain-containing protein [Alicyclobacillus sp.]